MIVKTSLHQPRVRIQHYVLQLPVTHIAGFCQPGNFLPPLVKLTQLADRFFT